jgi:adenylate kinase family enzyme
MQRIAIVGCSGAGKSTLARALARKLDLPVVHIDALFWQPGWKEGDREILRARLDAAAAADRWIIEGGFANQSAQRFARADTIVWVERPTWLCLWRAFRRMLTNFGRTRADLAPGCPERFDLAFYLYILNWNQSARPGLTAALAEHALQARLIRLASDRDTLRFLAWCEPSTAEAV